MPTSSYFRPITITGKKHVKKFIRSLESAERFAKEKPVLKVEVNNSNMSKEDITRIFGKK